MKVYSVYDKVTRRYKSLTYAENDESFVRSSLFSILMDYPYRDVTLYQVGEFDPQTGKLKAIKPKEVSMSSYVFPKSTLSVGENLSVDEIDEFAKKHKENMVAQLSKKKQKEVVNE